MPDFRGRRFSKTGKFGPPKNAGRARVPQPLSGLGGGRELPTKSGAAAFCEGNTKFIGGTVSLPECYAYWALRKIFGDEGEHWGYQVSILGGRHLPGGAVIDFVIYQGITNIAVRVQGWYRHFTQGSFVQALDQAQLESILGYGWRVIDVFDYEILRDETGKNALRVMNDAAQGVQHSNPLLISIRAT